LDPSATLVTPSSPSLVFVIGAAGGIGSALCRRLAARGAKLVLAGRNAETLRALASEVGGDVVPLDARDFDAVSAAVNATVERHGRLDGAVNLAGSIVLKAAHATSAQDWDDVIATNLRTAFALVRAVAPVMGRAGGGSVVLMSSAAARVGLANHDALAAAKAGVTGLALSAAATYAPRGVRINVVAPGLVRTPLAARLVSSEASLKASESMHALGRIGEPEDVASLLDWLLDPAQRWVTGQVFGVDGGLSTLRAR
jgi:NAD(P)-dependent dehydrogenase (short-subunit alcohol dehydrogenase family)